MRNIIAPRLISATNVEGRTFSNALDGICTTAHSDADVSMAQIYLDDILLSIYNELAVGSNAILPVSLAFAKAMAKMHKIPLFIMIRWLLLTIQNRLNIGYEFKEMSRYTRPIKERQANRPGSEIAFPIPMLNLVNGGAHASTSLDIQEFMIVPVGAATIADALRMASEIFMTLQKNLKTIGHNTNIGDEGGFASGFTSTRSALDGLMEAIYQCGYTDSVKLALDAASSEFYKDDKYQMQGEGLLLKSSMLIKYYEALIRDYPIISIEDAMAENDWLGWQDITAALGDKIMLVGDDLFTTNEETLQYGIENGAANAILIKPNQVGTLTDAIKTIALAMSSGYQPIISHRSGETEDTTIAHLAYGVGSPYIKAGSICRTDRLCKYNEMLRIAEYNSTV